MKYESSAKTASIKDDQSVFPFDQPQAVDVVTDISYRDFVKKYSAPGRPVIIRGALQELPASQWTPAVLKEKWGDKSFEVDGESMMLSDIVEQILVSTTENPAPYLRSVDVATEFPELMPDLVPGITYAWPNYRYLSFLLPSWYFPVDGRYAEFFFGGCGGGFPFGHADYPPMNTFIGLFCGEKEWIAFPPEDRDKLYIKDNGFTHSKVENLFEPDFEKYPELRQVKPFRCHQQAGDLFLMPCNWIHTARNHSPTMSVSWDQLSHASWDQFISDKYRRTVGSKPFRARLVNMYLRALGGVLGIGERLVGRVTGGSFKGRVL